MSEVREELLAEKTGLVPCHDRSDGAHELLECVDAGLVGKYHFVLARHAELDDAPRMGVAIGRDVVKRQRHRAPFQLRTSP